MSTRAYRINAIEYATGSTFNCHHDSDLLDHLLNTEASMDIRTNDGCGIVEFSVEALEKAANGKSINLEKDVCQNLKADIAWAKASGKNYIMYDCI